MKLQAYLPSDLVTKLSEKQQKKFIDALQDEHYSSLAKLGLERALVILGYEVVEDGEENENSIR